MSSRHAAWILCAIFVLTASAQGDESAEAVDPPWTLSRLEPGEPPWASLLRIRAAEAVYRETPWWPTYLQMLAQAEAAAGHHRAALRNWDALTVARDSMGRLASGIEAVDAVEYLSAVADTSQILMINERHHAGSDRLLTLALLPVLRAKGFEYFAAETFSHGDPELRQRGYPVDETGSYVREPVFAAVVREALRLGYILVPYESTAEQNAQEDSSTPQQRRDRAQAQNLYDAIFAENAQAKVLVHAGYSHILEEARERWHPMALYLRELTGIDPVTVDQTRLSERSEARFEHPDYRASIAAGLLVDRPVILLDADGKPVSPADFAVDLQVLTPRTSYTHGRPDWMSLGGRRVRVRAEVPECASRHCFLEARLDSEPNEAIPLDWVELQDAKVTWFYLPEGQTVVLHVFDENGELLRAVKSSDSQALVVEER